MYYCLFQRDLQRWWLCTQRHCVSSTLWGFIALLWQATQCIINDQIFLSFVLLLIIVMPE